MIELNHQGNISQSVRLWKRAVLAGFGATAPDKAGDIAEAGVCISFVPRMFR
ncbi:MAG: hypothetical protein J0H00_15315 [Burkholderiales bacterium]|nr:hypothetical protein [Burkholderiales bacterium]